MYKKRYFEYSLFVCFVSRIGHTDLKSRIRFLLAGECMERPKIFDYHDYRIFLKDFFDYSKEKNGKFSFRFFAQRAGFNSGSILKLVIDGKKNLTNESINKISNGFKLKKREYEFFEKLVFMVSVYLTTPAISRGSG